MTYTYDIHKRVFKFVVAGLKIIRLIPQSTEGQIILNQYIRSLTSVGANDNEADGAASKKDFIHCYSIVRKELKETRYWLEILAALYSQHTDHFTPLLKESEELTKIISAIIQKSRD